MIPNIFFAAGRQMLTYRVKLAQALSSLALIFNLAFSTHVEAQVGSFFVRDFPVDNPALTDT